MATSEVYTSPLLNCTNRYVDPAQVFRMIHTPYERHASGQTFELFLNFSLQLLQSTHRINQCQRLIILTLKVALTYTDGSID